MSCYYCTIKQSQQAFSLQWSCLLHPGTQNNRCSTCSFMDAADAMAKQLVRYFTIQDCFCSCSTGQTYTRPSACLCVITVCCTKCTTSGANMHNDNNNYIHMLCRHIRLRYVRRNSTPSRHACSSRYVHMNAQPQGVCNSYRRQSC